MVQLEGNITAIRAQLDAIKALFDDERNSRRRAEARLEAHEASDNAKFTSIDSRLQGVQSQLSLISDTSKRIEGKVNDFEPRLKILEESSMSRTAVKRFLENAWAQVILGAGATGAAISIYSALK
jgi:predicted nuclease with TOPRIM domain